MSNSTLSSGSSSTSGPDLPLIERASAARAGGCTPAGGGPLGIPTKFPSPASTGSSQNASHTGYQPQNATACTGSPRVTRQQVDRFVLQSAARELLQRERVAFCLRRMRSASSTVDVLYVPAHQTAHYGGLCVCGSVWNCPVCAAKITERRRLELSAGLAAWPGYKLLVTFTLQHSMADNLSDVLGGLLKSYEGLRSGKWWPAFRDKYHLGGTIKATEVTYGSSGWHAHLHTSMLFEDEVKIIPFENELKERWSSQLARFGRYASWDYGVDVRFSDAHIAEYVAKFGREKRWTDAHELAKAPVKKGRANGRTPFQLLADYSQGDAVAGRLFMQYACNFKGKKQLVWSRGLRARLGLADEKTDQEVAAEQDEIAVILAQLTFRQWQVVLGNDARGELQEVASTGDSECIWSFLEGLGVQRVQVSY